VRKPRRFPALKYEPRAIASRTCRHVMLCLVDAHWSALLPSVRDDSARTHEPQSRLSRHGKCHSHERGENRDGPDHPALDSNSRRSAGSSLCSVNGRGRSRSPDLCRQQDLAASPRTLAAADTRRSTRPAPCAGQCHNLPRGRDGLRGCKRTYAPKLGASAASVGEVSAVAG
jgi:hypothetical protein